MRTVALLVVFLLALGSGFALAETPTAPAIQPLQSCQPLTDAQLKELRGMQADRHTPLACQVLGIGFQVYCNISALKCQIIPCRTIPR